MSSDEMFFFVGNPAQSCITNPTRNFKLEYDYEPGYDFRNSNIYTSRINEAFGEARVNIVYSRVDPNDPANYTINYFDAQATQNVMMQKLFSYTNRYWTDKELTDGYIVSIDRITNPPSNLPDADGITVRDPVLYPELKSPSFIFYGLHPNFQKDQHSVKAFIHEIGHKIGIWTHGGHSTEMICCVMNSPIIYGNCTLSNFKFCNNHKCYIHLAQF